MHGFSPGPPVSSHSPKNLKNLLVSWSDQSKLTVGVSVSGCLSLALPPRVDPPLPSLDSWERFQQTCDPSVDKVGTENGWTIAYQHRNDLWLVELFQSSKVLFFKESALYLTLTLTENENTDIALSCISNVFPFFAKTVQLLERKSIRLSQQLLDTHVWISMGAPIIPSIPLNLWILGVVLFNQ